MAFESMRPGSIVERVITYIDGFNLYFGLQSAGWRSMLWLDLRRLSSELLIRKQRLQHTKYFTARVSSPSDKVKRQNTYLEALDTLPDTTLQFGKFLQSPRVCPRCNYRDNVPSEKMTDVNIAVEMLSDAFQDRFDTAILISGDSDLCGPIAKIREMFPKKRVVCAFPPNRVSSELKKFASAYFMIGRAKIRRSQFPLEVRSNSGYTLRRPAEWK